MKNGKGIPMPKKREMKNSLTKFVLRKFTKLYLDFKNKSFYGQ